MTIEIKRNAGETVVELVGRLDTTTAPALDKTVSEDLRDTKKLILDLKGVEYVSSAGLRVLLGMEKRMHKVGEMKLVNVCDTVMEVFEMTGFADILTIE